MILIDYSDKRPIYEQIAARFEALIVSGVMEADEKLPSVRTLAVELSINPNTIQRAYMELEKDGFIYTVKGKGNFVKRDEGLIHRQKERLLGELYEQALARYNKFSGSSEDADKLYQDIITLRQAITEAEVKAAEQAKEDRIAQAAMYALQAKEAARSKDTKTARQLYDKALAIYKEQNIWDERTEAVYNEIDALENGSAQQPAENTPSNDGAGIGEQAG